MLLEFKHEMESFPDEEMRLYFKSQIDGFLEQLRAASNMTPVGQEEFASLADHLIMNFSMEIAAKFELKEFPIEKHFLPITEMVKNQPVLSFGSQENNIANS